MNESTANTAADQAEYRCPGADHPIPQAVHLGRLAAFYPPCRQCPMRDDTGQLSPRQVKRLAETRQRGQSRELFHDGVVSGVYLNDLGPVELRKLGAALGMFLRSGEPEPSVGEPRESAPGRRAPPVEVLLAGDGRPLAPELVAAASEGLRWTGCGVIDLGSASAPCVAFAAGRLGAGGAMLIGNPEGRKAAVGVRLWRGGQLLAAGPAMDEVRRLFESRLDRPTRRFGPSRREDVEQDYLAQFAGDYHGLRPLRFVVHCTCAPVLDYLRALIAPTECQMLPCPALPRASREEIVRAAAHFGASIGDDGRSVCVWDEQGREVAADRLPSPALPDAVAAITRLLALLSQSDRELSAVLDTAPAAP